MTFTDFKESLTKSSPPAGAHILLVSLWYDAKNDWQKAHELINDLNGTNAAWVHAYLHRKEGDTGNAAYWYRRAGKPTTHKGFEEEWTEITHALLQMASS